MTDHYEALGLASTATREDIRVAYRRRLEDMHPDNGPGNEEAYEAVVQAGNVLLQEDKRKAYDLKLKLRESEEPAQVAASAAAAGSGAVASAAARTQSRVPGAPTVATATDVVTKTAAAKKVPAASVGTTSGGSNGRNMAIAGALGAAALLGILFFALRGGSESDLAVDTGDVAVAAQTASEAGDDGTAADADVAAETETPVEEAAPAPVEAEEADVVAEADAPVDAGGAESEAVVAVSDTTDPEASGDDAASESDVEDADVEDAGAEPVATVEDTVEEPAAPLPNLEDLPERAAIYRPPLLYLVGAVPTQEIKDEIERRSGAVVGVENVVNEYVVHPDASFDLDGRVRVEQAIKFESNSAAIEPESEAILAVAFQVLTSYPDASVIVEGHTDAIGDDELNRQLSQRRADAVGTWLIDRGIDASRVDAIGLGETDPLEDNATAVGRAANRRIEFDVLNLLGDFSTDQ